METDCVNVQLYLLSYIQPMLINSNFKSLFFLNLNNLKSIKKRVNFQALFLLGLLKENKYLVQLNYACKISSPTDERNKNWDQK